MFVVRTIALRIIGSLLAVALTFAPVTWAAGACGQPAKAHDNAATAMSADMPCDAPCNDCAPDLAKKGCTGDCVCAPMVFAFVPAAPFKRITAQQIAVDSLTAPIPFAHPPDTPPPRSLPEML